MSRRPRTDFRVSAEIIEEKKHLNTLMRAAKAVERDVDRLIEEKNIRMGRIEQLERSLGGELAGGGESKTREGPDIAESEDGVDGGEDIAGSEDESTDWDSRFKSRFKSRFRMGSSTLQSAEDDDFNISATDDLSDFDAPQRKKRISQDAGLPQAKSKDFNGY